MGRDADRTFERFEPIPMMMRSKCTGRPTRECQTQYCRAPGREPHTGYPTNSLFESTLKTGSGATKASRPLTPPKEESPVRNGCSNLSLHLDRPLKLTLLGENPRNGGYSDQSRPSILRLAAASAPERAKSSNALLAASMICRAIKGAPSAAPCAALFTQHSHSSTAHPSYPYWVSLEKTRRNSTCPSPGERKRPARFTQD